MASWKSSAVLAVAAALVPLGLEAADPGPHARVCPQCPEGAIFIECRQGVATISVALPPGEETGFRMAAWKGVIVATARRVAPQSVDLTVASKHLGKKTTRRLRLGETLILRPGKDIDAETVGGLRGPVECTWVE